ncbi:FAD-dependent oxidoreductase [Clostridium peptidivorans]|uniref:FAD-dependent oxidoreductase n=1 Tax=Clostridium peptidivorans TaxID=100174 RepID=UPI000BE2A9A3|nr:FAD-dependent oxidoreductase [Clostridium peptidivorans]
MAKINKLAYGEQNVQDYNIRTAVEEASRCLLCEDSPCSKACPALTDPGKFIRSIRFKNIKGAAEVVRFNNILGASCAMICPHENLCEKACSRTGIDKPINIGKLQKFAMDQEKLFNLKVLKAPEKKTEEKIACIGSGPASLACAAKLALEGYQVTVFEEKEKLGGMLTYGITPSRLSQEVVDQDINCLKELGVEFRTNEHIAPEDIKKLKNEYKAIFIGIGLAKSKDIKIEGHDLDGVENALSFLANARSSNGKVKVGNNVVVIGLGDVALDCAITAKQLSKGKVSIVYRRSIEESPAHSAELTYTQGMGIPIYTEFAPEKILGEDNKAIALVCKSRDGYSEMKLKADHIIFAIGQEPYEEYKNYTLEDGLFAAGDFTNGGKTVVEAVAEGKESAEKIIAYLNK